jgi:3-oxoacyl-[acyl-carrier protein] reductase
VVLVGRDEDRARAAAADPMAQGLDAVGLGCNIADAGAVRALSGLLGPLARVDLLVCAAGVMSERTAKTLRTSDTEWRRVMAVNLDGAFTTISTFVPGMAERRHGRVVTLSACLGR